MISAPFGKLCSHTFRFIYILRAGVLTCSVCACSRAYPDLAVAPTCNWWSLSATTRASLASGWWRTSGASISCDRSDLDPLITGLAAQRASGARRRHCRRWSLSAPRPWATSIALHALWRELGPDDAVSRAMRSSLSPLDATAMVRAMVFNRLCEPGVKLGVLRWLDTVPSRSNPSR